VTQRVDGENLDNLIDMGDEAAFTEADVFFHALAGYYQACKTERRPAAVELEYAFQHMRGTVHDAKNPKIRVIDLSHYDVDLQHPRPPRIGPHPYERILFQFANTIVYSELGRTEPFATDITRFQHARQGIEAALSHADLSSHESRQIVAAAEDMLANDTVYGIDSTLAVPDCIEDHDWNRFRQLKQIIRLQRLKAL